LLTFLFDATPHHRYNAAVAVLTKNGMVLGLRQAFALEAAISPARLLT
jgi:hypothetical protein